MDKNRNTPIVALIGSTASGKSDLALQVAKETGAVILSCDSLLVYRNLNIGTAKPTLEEQSAVAHFGIDLVDLDKEFNAGDYVRYARPLIDKFVKEGKPILIVGGTGFYLKALLCGVWDAPPTQPEIRQKLEDEVASLPEEERSQFLFEKLKSKDPNYAEKIKANDRYRVIRALEIIEVTGKTMQELTEGKQLQNPLPYPFKVVGIRRSKEELEKRIIARTNKMFSQGLVQETKNLTQAFQKDSEPMLRPFECVGYYEVIQFLKGEMNLPDCRERIVISTRQLAKKQMTFFKTFPTPIEWFNLPSEEDEILRYLRRELNNFGE